MLFIATPAPIPDQKARVDITTPDGVPIESIHPGPGPSLPPLESLRTHGWDQTGDEAGDLTPGNHMAITIIDHPRVLTRLSRLAGEVPADQARIDAFDIVLSLFIRNNPGYPILIHGLRSLMDVTLESPVRGPLARGLLRLITARRESLNEAAIVAEMNAKTVTAIADGCPHPTGAARVARDVAESLGR